MDSAQNFLNLLFQGLGTVPEQVRQNRQRKTDLFLTLYGMREQSAARQQQQRMAEKQFGLAEDRLGLQREQMAQQQAAAKRAEMERAAGVYREGLKGYEAGRQRATALREAQSALKSLGLPEGLAGMPNVAATLAAAMGRQQGAGDAAAQKALAQERLAVQASLNHLVKSPESYEYRIMNQDELEKEDPLTRGEWQPVANVGGNRTRYRRVLPKAAREIEKARKRLAEIGKLVSPEEKAFTETAGQTFAAPEDVVDIDEIEAMMGEWAEGE